jgi:sigma-B regulation protein RsbQ
MKDDVVRRNNVHITGRGAKLMMFAHGFGCDQHMWRFVAPHFERDYRVVLFDYVGHGQSDWTAYDPRRYDSLQGYAEDVLEICRVLDLKDVIFVGHSVSSIVGILATLQEPERFARLILVGPSPRYINDPPDYVGGFERQDIEGLLEMMERNYAGFAAVLAQTVIKNPNRPELTQELTDKFCATSPQVARQFAEVTFLSDNRADLAKVRVPSLIMQCSEDSIAPMEVGEYLHRHLPASTMRILQATGHCPQMSHPDETIRVIRAYLQQELPKTA